MESSGKASGLIELSPEEIEEVPEGPGVFELIATSQKVIYVDSAGERGLREAIREIFEEHVLSVATFFRYTTTADEAEAQELARRKIEAERPPHNVGYDRYRFSDTKISKQGRRVRHAAPNP